MVVSQAIIARIDNANEELGCFSCEISMHWFAWNGRDRHIVGSQRQQSQNPHENKIGSLDHGDKGANKHDFPKGSP